MEINADFSKRVVVHAAQLDWQYSPIPGVQRRMLDRIGDEVARATSIVRYEPGSQFSPHVHTGGEEFIVLEGIFQDEHGDFPTGSYIRNPPESSHTPGSESGCVIFVKLWQFDLNDRKHLRLISPHEADITRDSNTVIPLHHDERENVQLQRWSPFTETTIKAEGGAEVLVLEGSFEEGSDIFQTQSWLRVPVGGTIKAKAGTKGAKVWVKTGHLRFIETPR